ncbi:thiamine-phosphate kinase [Rothia sp. ZJ1223]|uniref:thiamine-phosphate kinase n=1 Tax=Rothia sp. ZJ1223 TaxID=2811098 RepID=UPI001956FBD6|nr:thiamine-phosphate kinase [Rothia sp. ZJ1223]MBM7050934.1 thiamine-phosphate kinase [Rothia sp. ZJ1223]
MAQVSDFSEQEIIAAFAPQLSAHNQRAQERSQVLVTGPGDDAAVLDLRGALTVVTTDTQTEGQDFRLEWSSGAITGGYDVGWKAATQNLADVASMGAQPASMVVSLSLPPHTPLEFVTDFAKGLTDACVAMGASTCTIAGGDIGGSTEISVTVTALGTTLHPVYRSGARPGHILAVAGELGTAAAGLELLDSPLSNHVFETNARACVSAQQRPVAPLAAGVAAAGKASAMMDISDGPLRDAARIAAASQVSLNFSSQALEPFIAPLVPVAKLLQDTDEALEHGTPYELAQKWVLTGGENHGLLATFSRVDEMPADFVQVGTCFAYDKNQPVTVDGAVYAGQGWDHFE